VFEIKVLRKIFGTKKEEIRVRWRRLHKEEIYDLYSTSSTITVTKERIRGAGNVARMVEMRSAYKDLVRKPERKIPLGKPKHRSESIKLGLKEIR
jgi:hypothetical protein